MEEILSDKPEEIQEVATDSILCVHCKKSSFEEGYSTKLCLDCREQFIKYPIPKWIWIFAGVIVLIMIMSMIRMPKYVSAAYHLGRAEKAIDKKAFFTAQKELLIVVESFPDNLTANCNLLIAAARNHEYAMAVFAYNKITGKEIDDNDLYTVLQNSIQSVEADFPNDTSLLAKIVLSKDSSNDLMQIYNFLAFKDNIDQHIAGVHIASKFYDRDLYLEADSILSKVLSKKSDYYPALSLMTGVKRNLKQYDMSIAICDRMLEENSEDILAISQKSKTELKRHQDAKAAEYAAEAMRIDPNNIYALEAQVMVDYYANRKTEVTAQLAKIVEAENGGDNIISTRVENLVNGKIIYR